MINRIGKWFDYLYYLLNANNRHGVHSPFVYEFVDRVLYNISSEKVEYLEHQRTQMIQSRKSGFDNLSLSEYVFKNTLPSKYCELMQRMVLHYGIKQIHDIGPSTGIEFNYLRYMKISGLVPDLSLFYRNSVEPYSSLFKRSQDEFNKAFNLTMDEDDVEFSQTDFSDKSLFLFHRLDMESSFWEQLDQVKENSSDHDFFVFSQLYDNENSKLNWQRIINDTDFHVTIDCFHLGIALKRTQQVKEHFQLRY